MSGFTFGASTTTGSSGFSFGTPATSTAGNAPAPAFSLGTNPPAAAAAPFSFGGLGSTAGQYKIFCPVFWTFIISG